MPLQKLLALERVQRGARQRCVAAWREADHRAPPPAMHDVSHVADVVHPRWSFRFAVVARDRGDPCGGEQLLEVVGVHSHQQHDALMLIFAAQKARHARLGRCPRDCLGVWIFGARAGHWGAGGLGARVWQHRC